MAITMFLTLTSHPQKQVGSSSANGEVCKQDCHDHAYSCIHVSQTKADEICTPPQSENTSRTYADVTKSGAQVDHDYCIKTDLF